MRWVLLKTKIHKKRVYFEKKRNSNHFGENIYVNNYGDVFNINMLKSLMYLE